MHDKYLAQRPQLQHLADTLLGSDYMSWKPSEGQEHEPVERNGVYPNSFWPAAIAVHQRTAGLA